MLYRLVRMRKYEPWKYQNLWNHPPAMPGPEVPAEVANEYARRTIKAIGKGAWFTYSHSPDPEQYSGPNKDRAVITDYLTWKHQQPAAERWEQMELPFA